jgi:hypothetical protein
MALEFSRRHFFFGCLFAGAVHYDCKLFWNNEKRGSTDNKGTNRWLKAEFRNGWELSI